MTDRQNDTKRQENIMVELELQVGQKSDVGPARELNEDFVASFVPTDSELRRSKGAIFLMADGMGGHQAGEVASRGAVEKVIQEYYDNQAHKPGDSLVRAFKVANQVLFERAQSDPSKAGMGTTLVTAVVLGRKVYVANVGDSRAYLLTEKGISRITKDHSWVEEQVQAGLMTREQAERHPQRNVITRALGSNLSVEVDLFEGELHEGDVLLLCSDGLSGPLSERQIAHVVRSQPPPQAAAQLVAQAGAQRGEDNASVVIVQATRPRRPGLSSAQAQGSKDLPTQVSRPEDAAQGSSDSQASQAPGRLLATVGAWLHKPGALCIKEERQRLVAGLATLLFLCCLCAALAGLPAVGQRLVGNPAAAPQQAPIHHERALTWDQLGRLADDLGYSNPEEMRLAHPNPPVTDLWPAQRGIFLVGQVRDWNCQDPACTFRLEMAEESYQITCHRQFLEDDRTTLQGRQVRVFGYQQGEGAAVEARLIDLGAPWWAWWRQAWDTVYRDHEWGEPVWLYSIADRSPYSPIEMKDHPTLKRGDPVLIYGRWLEVLSKRDMGFETQGLYRLQAGRYVLVSGKPIVLPTATLRPGGG